MVAELGGGWPGIWKGAAEPLEVDVFDFFFNFFFSYYTLVLISR